MILDVIIFAGFTHRYGVPTAKTDFLKVQLILTISQLFSVNPVATTQPEQLTETIPVYPKAASFPCYRSPLNNNKTAKSLPPGI